MEQVGLPWICPRRLSNLDRSSVLCCRSVVSHRLTGTPVIAPACHDTGSAVAAISARNGTAFFSSGTWSLIGTELDDPVITPEALRLNFTNEGGVNGTTRLLKNVMGLWMLQGCRHCWTSQGHDTSMGHSWILPRNRNAFSHLVDPG